MSERALIGGQLLSPAALAQGLGEYYSLQEFSPGHVPVEVHNYAPCSDGSSSGAGTWGGSRRGLGGRRRQHPENHR